MAYNPVPTVATGDLWTASNHNTYIRDNFAVGVPDIFTNAGDLVYGTGVNAAARRAIGSNGQVLTVSGGLPVWGYAIPIIGYAEIPIGSGYSTSGGYSDVPGLSLNLTLPAAGKIIAFATAVVKRSNVYDEAAMRLVIDGIANPIVNQFKKYTTPDDQLQGNFPQVYLRSVAAGARNIKVQLANTGTGGGDATLYWGNVLAIGFPGA
ncbi:MAG: hypothetical protein ACYC3H_01435 [Bellilinea sp.]